MVDVIVQKIVIACHYKYSGATGKIGETEVYFKDGTTLRLDGHYVLKVGVTYTITYTEGNKPPVEPTAITMFAG